MKTLGLDNTFALDVGSTRYRPRDDNWRVFGLSCEASVIASLLRVAHHCEVVRPPAKSDRRARPLILVQSRSASGSPLAGPPPPLPCRSAPAYHSRTDSYLPWSRSEAACPLKSSISLRPMPSRLLRWPTSFKISQWFLVGVSFRRICAAPSFVVITTSRRPSLSMLPMAIPRPTQGSLKTLPAAAEISANFPPVLRIKTGGSR